MAHKGKTQLNIYVYPYGTLVTNYADQNPSRAVNRHYWPYIIQIRTAALLRSLQARYAAAAINREIRLRMRVERKSCQWGKTEV